MLQQTLWRKTELTSKDTVDYLKGGAILAIAATHYASFYAQEVYNRRLTEYGSLLVSLFFVLGGYLAYTSLEKRFGGDSPLLRSLLGYYYGRAARIYPLFWAALLVTPFVLPLPGFVELHQPSLHTLGIYLGVPWLRGPGPFWFVSAIIQCFLLAPFLYLLLKKLRPLAFFIFILLSTLVLFGATLIFNHRGMIGEIQPWIYRDFFLGNILLFSLGLLIPAAGRNFNRVFRGNAAKLTVAGFSTLVFLGLLWSIRSKDKLFEDSWLVLTPAFFLATFAFCLAMVSTGPPVPFRRSLVFCGACSYSIYLFHRAFFGLLATMGLVQDGSRRSVVYTLALMPVFILLCCLIEPRVNTLTDRLGGKLGFGRKSVRERPAES